VWHFAQTSENLFKEYVKTFYKKKLLSSKVPFESEKEVEKYIKNVMEKEKIEIKNISQFQENPGLRQLTKLMLNNLWGRFGMQENLSKCTFITQFEKLVKFLEDDSIEIQGLRVVSGTVVQVIHRAKTSEFLEMSRDTNIFIAIATTAWARMRLYEELDKLKERALYCDTDSVIYKKCDVDSMNLTTGHFLGEMTDELDSGEYIVDFVSGGPKNYGYRTNRGKCVAKIKGFTVGNEVNTAAFSLDNIKKVLINGLMTADDDDQGDSLRVKMLNAKKRKVDNLACREAHFEEHMKEASKTSAIWGEKGISVFNPTRILRTRDWKILKKPEQKLYSFYFDKRIVLSNFDTIPFGYIGPIG
jgi:hypothetical protein